MSETTGDDYEIRLRAWIDRQYDSIRRALDFPIDEQEEA